MLCLLFYNRIHRMNETFHAENFDPINIKTINSRCERHSKASNPIYWKWYFSLEGNYNSRITITKYKFLMYIILWLNLAKLVIIWSVLYLDKSFKVDKYDVEHVDFRLAHNRYSWIVDALESRLRHTNEHRIKNF